VIAHSSRILILSQYQNSYVVQHCICVLFICDFFVILPKYCDYSLLVILVTVACINVHVNHLVFTVV